MKYKVERHAMVRRDYGLYRVIDTTLDTVVESHLDEVNANKICRFLNDCARAEAEEALLEAANEQEF